jgi:tRNA-splicing endonuclease subunit Sen2
MPLKDLWLAFNAAYDLEQPAASTLAVKPDNGFIVHYAVYHHFRSLGWVVKSGIKFCVDYLLYKRGPVFHHAE